jgi:hypothetical protein
MKVCPIHGAKMVLRSRQCNHPDCQEIITTTCSHGEVPIRCKKHAAEAKEAARRKANKKRYLPKDDVPMEIAKFPPFRNPDCVHYSECLDRAARGNGHLKCAGCRKFEAVEWVDYEVQRREWSEAVV